MHSDGMDQTFTIMAKFCYTKVFVREDWILATRQLAEASRTTFPFDPSAHTPMLISNGVSLVFWDISESLKLGIWDKRNAHETPSTQKKGQVVCSVEFHRTLVDVVKQLCIDKEGSMRIRGLIHSERFITHTVANYLQKYRLHLRRTAALKIHQNNFFAMEFYIPCKDYLTMVLFAGSTDVTGIVKFYCRITFIDHLLTQFLFGPRENFLFINSCGPSLVLGVWDPGITFTTMTLQGHTKCTASKSNIKVWDPGRLLFIMQYGFLYFPFARLGYLKWQVPIAHKYSLLATFLPKYKAALCFQLYYCISLSKNMTRKSHPELAIHETSQNDVWISYQSALLSVGFNAPLLRVYECDCGLSKETTVRYLQKLIENSHNAWYVAYEGVLFLIKLCACSDIYGELVSLACELLQNLGGFGGITFLMAEGVMLVFFKHAKLSDEVSGAYIFCKIDSSSMMLYQNLEDKVLIEGGSIVMNGLDDSDQVEVFGPKRCVYLGQGIKQPNKRVDLVWDPGGAKLTP